MRGRLLLAVLAGAAGCGCGVALLAVSGFLLARASQHPNIVAISMAVVAVRALSVGRGLFRYLERLCSHDVAFRVLAGLMPLNTQLQSSGGTMRTGQCACWAT